jgi:hypothetical protein
MDIDLECFTGPDHLSIFHCDHLAEYPGSAFSGVHEAPGSLDEDLDHHDARQDGDSREVVLEVCLVRPDLLDGTDTFLGLLQDAVDEGVLHVVEIHG